MNDRTNPDDAIRSERPGPDSSRQQMDRRAFVRRLSAVPAAAQAAISAAGVASAQQSGGRAEPAEPLIGIQMGPHTMLEEGIEPCLDLIQETAAINTVMVYSHTYYPNIRKPSRILAQDHGKPTRDLRNINFPHVWVRHHEKYFRGTLLRHQQVDDSFEYADRDLFAELVEPMRKRGMKLYARILEASRRPVVETVEGFSSAMVHDVYGRPVPYGCWNHPDYRAWWNATVEDMFRSYDLDGLQWGAERSGPLTNMVFARNQYAPFCFCEHCQARGRSKGIDPERARQGYEELFRYTRGLPDGTTKPVDGVFAEFLRLLFRYPEILSWEYEFRLAREEVHQEIYGTVKGIKPDAQVGWHVNHMPSSWDIIYRAQMSYAEMAPYSDFVKFIAYHDVLGPRIRWWYLELLKNGLLSEVSLEESLKLYYSVFGYDKSTSPTVDELETKSFATQYVYSETKRSVASAAGKTKIYPGIGFDVPWESDTVEGDPEEIGQCVVTAFEAGANGVVASREYDEMRVPNLKGFGQGVREVLKARV